MKEILNYLFEHKTLSKEKAKDVLTKIAKGTYSYSEMAAFISVYLMRSITVEELSGFREAMMELCIPIDFSMFDTIDLCGTGGDEKNTFNISTLSSFVVAGAGGKVVKHGNVGVSSSCGSSNMMEYFGYQFTNDRDKLFHELDTCGICYLHAPLFNPAMKNIGPVRRELKVKTFFNMLGPMVNPCFPKKQLIGVYSLELARLYNYLYQQTSTNYAIVHSLDGYDEVSLTGPFKLISQKAEVLLQPEDMGLHRTLASEIKGGESIADGAAIFANILEGKGSQAQREVIYANAGMALTCYYPGKSVIDCVDLARQSLDSGEALKRFKKLLNR